MSDTNKSAPATKDDLKDLATKTELKELGQELTGKIDSLDNRVARLEDVTKNIALDMVRAQSDIKDIKERMATKDDINRILNAIDTFAGEAKDYRRKDVERGHIMMVHEDKLTDHETRLQKLEVK